ncbi:MAG: helix-turn-helix domain-containing protein [Acidimicrobiales bacterium]
MESGRETTSRTEDGGSSDDLPELRRVSDARTLRALAHPVRIALIETLSLRGALTATEAAELIGESPTTCSFHLRQLAKYGFVEEAGGGKGRARPWQMSSIGMTISTEGDDPEAELAAGALMRLLHERQLDRYRTWLQTRASYPKAWQKAAGESEHVFYLTVEELEALSAELLAFLLPRYRERLTDLAARPAGAIPVELLLFTYPIAAPPAEG